MILIIRSILEFLVIIAIAVLYFYQPELIEFEDKIIDKIFKKSDSEVRK